MSPTTSPFGPLAVLLDPRAGHGVVAREVDAVEHALEARGLEYRLHVGGSSQELRDLSAAALDEGYRFLAAVGDDGTVQDVVNGMFREGRPIVEAPVLGVVAANSGSDLPLSFGLPGDTERAIGHLAGADTYPFDLMKIAVTGPDGARAIRYAHNVAEIGFHAAATIAASRGGARFQNLKRFAAFWRAYARTRVGPVTIGTDRRSVELDAWSVVIGNGQFSDGGSGSRPGRSRRRGAGRARVHRAEIQRLPTPAAGLPARRPRARPVDHGGPREAEDRRHVRTARFPWSPTGWRLGRRPSRSRWSRNRSSSRSEP